MVNLIVVMKMKKKFKEYRMFILCLLILIAFVILGVIWFIQGRISLVIGALLLIGIDAILLFARYKIILFDDMMIIYEWKILAMLPTVIEYKDIQSIEKKSQHQLYIYHQKRSSIYVMNADEFIDAYQELSTVNNKD